MKFGEVGRFKFTDAPEPRKSDAELREGILKHWTNMGMKEQHCGGHGLSIGCPVCGRRYGS